MKRTFDFITALVLVSILSPLILLVAILVRLKLGSPVLFSQIRPGLFAVPFKILKFRSMTNAKDEHGIILPNTQRMTKFGTFLRSTSLDELPSLFNVIKGEMSLVGPRPLLMEYLALYSDFQKRRMEMKPGITGWTQTHGRNALSWDEKFKLDIWYVDHQSLWLDVKILWITMIKVIKREGITHAEDIAMPRFTGNNT